MDVNNHSEDNRIQSTEALVQDYEKLWSEMIQRWSAEEELRESAQTLRTLSAQLLTFQETERKRLARELHDGVSQLLTTIKFSIENGLEQGLFQPSSENNITIGRILGRIQSAIEEMHRISTSLYPAMLDDLGIIPTISWYCRAFQASNQHIRIKTHIEVTESEIPQVLKPVIYRIFQEALTNIARHAGNGNASLQLRRSDTQTQLELIISDTGVGFDNTLLTRPENEFKCTGIPCMKCRAELSGGSLNISSERGSGTTIRVALPMQR